MVGIHTTFSEDFVVESLSYIGCHNWTPSRNASASVSVPYGFTINLLPGSNSCTPAVAVVG